MSGHLTVGGMSRWSDGPLVGRDELVAELLEAADAAARGSGSIVLLTGEAGIGKTSVARAVAQQVRARLAVSWGTCVPDRTAPPYWPWQALVTLEPSGSQGTTGQAIGAPRFEWLNVLDEGVRARVREQPRLHVIEDLQWADVASVLLLRHLAATILDTPLLVVATLRTGESASLQLEEAIEEVRRVARVHELPALDATDVASLIRHADAEPDDDLVVLVQTRTRGNPLLVSELLRSVPLAQPAQRRLAMMAETVPARVSDLTRLRLSRLPAAVSAALLTASVMGSEGDTSILAKAHGTDQLTLLDLLDQGRAARFLDTVAAGRWQFRHQLIRDAVYASVAEATRAHRHALVLEALAAAPSVAPSTVAHHALAALPLLDADRAVALAARAGEDAFAHHAYEEAVDWFTRALAAAPSETAPRWRAELLVLSGEAHRHMGNIDAARRAFVSAAELTDDPTLLARAALGHADQGADLGIAYRSDDSSTAALLERALAAQPSTNSVIAVQLEARLAAELYFSEQPKRARALAYSSLERARQLGDPRAMGTATAVVHDAFVIGRAHIDEQLRESAQLLTWARGTGSVAALLSAHRARVFDLLAAGDLTAMDGEILAFRRLAEPLGAPGYLWWPALWGAMRALLEGRHAVAEQRALAAFQTGEAPFTTLSFFNLSFLLFFLRREQGRLGEMEQATRDYAASHADVPAIRVALAFLLAEMGRIDEARGALAAFDDAAIELLHDRNWPASWFQLARASSIVCDRSLAAVLLEAGNRPSERCVQVSLATVCLGATDLAVAWLFHTVGDLDAADAHYRSAEQLNARIGARSWLAQARADHARMLVERDGPGDGETAAHLLTLARATADEIGLATIAVSAEARQESTPARFRREGSVWVLTYAGRTVQLRNARGLQDLAYLLARHGEAVSVMELAHDTEAASAGTRGAPAFDERARRQIRERLHRLDSDEADAEATGDGERAALIREQRQQLAEAVARDLGLGGRARLIGDPVERARKTVSTRIRRTIATIAGVHPPLGRHLERSIDTGAWCAYRPVEPVDWHT